MPIDHRTPCASARASGTSGERVSIVKDHRTARCVTLGETGRAVARRAIALNQERAPLSPWTAGLLLGGVAGVRVATSALLGSPLCFGGERSDGDLGASAVFDGAPGGAGGGVGRGG